MNDKKNLLIEIGCEELSPQSLKQLSTQFESLLKTNLEKAGLAYGSTKSYATPRRIAVLVKQLSSVQKNRTLEKKGPAQQVAFDESGKPTDATLGFALSCGVSVNELTLKETEKGNFLFFEQVVPGKNVKDLLPELLTATLSKLSIKKPMRWGNNNVTFARPVHWVLALFGNETIKMNLLGVISDNKTFGHRFHHPEPITLNDPEDYEKTLIKSCVIPDFDERKKTIIKEIQKLTQDKGHVILDDDLLNEVTGLVEWPIALLGQFEKRFLEVPNEALITAMKQHQKSFPMVDDEGQLLPYFITISNIKSKKPDHVIKGNERVIRARLSDAEFFFRTDLKHSLENHLETLHHVIFQKKLGSMYDKVKRISKLSKIIAEKLNADIKITERAGLLCKSDLMTQMVNEFPELQGTMGYYYALQDKEPKEIALCIKEHYFPRFSGDKLPSTLESCVVSLSDKLDTIVGLFGTNQPPTGEKDPFALRRAAMGILRIIIEKKLNIDLKEIIEETINLYSNRITNPNTLNQVLDFIFDRLRAWYTDQSISSDVFNAVNARSPTQPLNFHHRIQAVQHFKTLPEAQFLASANKRVNNILKQKGEAFIHSQINYSLLEQEEEKALAQLIEKQSKETEHLCKENRYTDALVNLASLKNPIDRFFDKVLVMTDDERIRANRFALLNNLRNLFLLIADISLLQW